MGLELSPLADGVIRKPCSFGEVCTLSHWSASLLRHKMISTLISIDPSVQPSRATCPHLTLIAHILCISSSLALALVCFQMFPLRPVSMRFRWTCIKSLSVRFSYWFKPNAADWGADVAYETRSWNPHVSHGLCAVLGTVLSVACEGWRTCPIRLQWLLECVLCMAHYYRPRLFPW